MSIARHAMPRPLSINPAFQAGILRPLGRMVCDIFRRKILSLLHMSFFYSNFVPQNYIIVYGPGLYKPNKYGGEIKYHGILR